MTQSEAHEMLVKMYNERPRREIKKWIRAVDNLLATDMVPAGIQAEIEYWDYCHAPAKKGGRR